MGGWCDIAYRTIDHLGSTLPSTSTRYRYTALSTGEEATGAARVEILLKMALSPPRRPKSAPTACSTLYRAEDCCSAPRDSRAARSRRRCRGARRSAAARRPRGDCPFLFPGPVSPRQGAARGSRTIPYKNPPHPQTAYLKLSLAFFLNCTASYGSCNN